jgi:hypothetical protein
MHGVSRGRLPRAFVLFVLCARTTGYQLPAIG